MYDLARVSSHQWAISLARATRSGAPWPSPLNHSRRSGPFITVTIISISLTHKSCHKSSGISYCDNMHDQCTVAGGGLEGLARVPPSVLRGLKLVKGVFVNQQSRPRGGVYRHWIWTPWTLSQMSSPVVGPCVAAIRLLLSARTTKHHPHCAGSCSTQIMQRQRLTTVPRLCGLHCTQSIMQEHYYGPGAKCGLLSTLIWPVINKLYFILFFLCFRSHCNAAGPHRHILWELFCSFIWH